MRDLWKGIAIAGMWISIAVVGIHHAVAVPCMAVSALVATFIIAG